MARFATALMSFSFKMKTVWRYDVFLLFGCACAVPFSIQGDEQMLFEMNILPPDNPEATDGVNVKRTLRNKRIRGAERRIRYEPEE